MGQAVHHHLIQREQPALRLDARQLQPLVLCRLPAAEALRVLLPIGRDTVQLGELFTLRAGAAADVPTVTIEGDLSGFDHLGLGHHEGTMQLRGQVGHGVGLGMSGGRIEVHGDAKDLAGCSLRGGWLEVHGHVGDLAASALPGDMDGMRGGTFIIHGRAGARLADRMRRGTLVVHGDVGELAASRMVAGTLALGGRCGTHLGYGMRRGSIVLAGGAPAAQAMGPTFVPVRANADVFWQLLARDLARFGGAFAGLASRRITRLAGDLAVQGKGELLLPA
jgi:formylmethanofuran dehydrogenase subunit C